MEGLLLTKEKAEALMKRGLRIRTTRRQPMRGIGIVGSFGGGVEGSWYEACCAADALKLRDFRVARVGIGRQGSAFDEFAVDLDPTDEIAGGP